jgi:hypothetical protein
MNELMQIDPFWGNDPYAPNWPNYIVPVDEPSGSRAPTATTNAPSYETPWYVDSINRAIERAAQVATIEAGGYPPYPNYPLPTPPPVPQPAPMLAPGVQPQASGSGIQLSQTTLMLIVGGFLLFTLGKRGR